MLSIVIHLAIALIVAAAVACHCRRSSFSCTMRYFTTLSNVLCALTSLAVAGMRLGGAVSAPVLLLNYIGTVSVLVTLVTVAVFLGPQYGYKPLLSGPDLWLHLLCPLLALLSYLAWDRAPVTPLTGLIGVIPVVLYGLLYLQKVVFKQEWEDFYGFNRGGKWPLSFAAMVLGASLICLLLSLA